MSKFNGLQGASWPNGNHFLANMLCEAAYNELAKHLPPA
jgi:hypothetical protein